jgi:hypothetical protein
MTQGRHEYIIDFALFNLIHLSFGLVESAIVCNALLCVPPPRRALHGNRARLVRRCKLELAVEDQCMSGKERRSSAQALITVSTQ